MYFFKQHPPWFLWHLKALEISFSKLVLHAPKVHLFRELCPLKVYRLKTKIRVFTYGNNQIFVFHRQILRGHNSLKRWTFGACNISFEKLISRALRCHKNQGGCCLKKYTKSSSEDRPFLDAFYQWFYAISIGSTYLIFSGFIFEKSKNVPAGANLGVLPVPTPPYTCIFIHYRPGHL